jgi:hypothetical protein
MRFLYVWSVADIVLISFAVAATGGGRSDLFLLTRSPRSSSSASTTDVSGPCG